MDRVLLVDPIDPSAVSLLRERVEVIVCSEASFDGIRRDGRDADAVITRSRLPDDFFEHARKVRAAMIHGTGMDLVPIEAATAHGVAVSRLPGGNAQSVAEYCVMAMLMLGRNALEITTKIKTLPWDETRLLGARAHEISAMTVGIVGVGEIGRRVARICRHGFGMRVLGQQRRMDQLGPDAEPAALDRILDASDFIVLACPLTPETQHLFNRDRLSRMKSSAWLINVGRGAVIDEAALVEALRDGRIAGAMLDVYEHYRLAPGHPLFSLPNAVLTPHLAGMTQESRKRMGAAAAEETLRMLSGEPPKNFVNPEVWEKFHERRPENH
ncbi:MAG: hydroxyacid dehydrogenase [Candidatus Parcubacteria bacterium]|nr:hydroxyacid dehydrogenase [Burkholderiales bacterium]